MKDFLTRAAVAGSLTVAGCNDPETPKINEVQDVRVSEELDLNQIIGDVSADVNAMVCETSVRYEELPPLRIIEISNEEFPEFFKLIKDEGIAIREKDGSLSHQLILTDYYGSEYTFTINPDIETRIHIFGYDVDQKHLFDYDTILMNF